MGQEAKFLPQLEEILEVQPGTLGSDQEVRHLKHWDSMKLLELVAFADDQLHVEIEADNLAKCVTAGDIIALLTDAVASQIPGD